MMSICADFGVDRGADQYPPILSPFSLLSSTLSPPRQLDSLFLDFIFLYSRIEKIDRGEGVEREAPLPILLYTRLTTEHYRSSGASRAFFS